MASNNHPRKYFNYEIKRRERISDIIDDNIPEEIKQALHKMEKHQDLEISVLSNLNQLH